MGAMLAGAAGSTLLNAQAAKGRPIQLHCDLKVDPKREQELIDNFEKIFKPVAMKHEGYIDLKLLRLNKEIAGKAPAGCKYQFSLTFQSEELRQKWIASADHIRVWPSLENTLLDKNISIIIYDVF
jgi:hypothetical protein